MENYRKNSHSLYDLKLHVVWITKYRKPVLTGQTGQVLWEIIHRICEELDVQILAGNIRMDHVHSEIQLRIRHPDFIMISHLCTHDPQSAHLQIAGWLLAMGV